MVKEMLVLEFLLVQPAVPRPSGGPGDAEAAALADPAAVTSAA